MESSIEQLSYEAAFSQLEAILARLEGVDLPLEEAMSLYEQGAALATHCTRKLEEAELRVRQWLPNGDPKPFEGWQER